MNIFQKLAEKSWIPQPAGVELPLANLNQRPDSARTALNFFLAVVGVIFFLFSITFLSRTQFGDFQPLAGEPWSPLTNSSQLWINTLVILAAGVSVHLAHIFARQQKLNYLILTTSLGLFLTSVFLFGQIYVWQQLVAQGYFVTTNPANSFFYLLTAIHGLHLIGGLIALVRVLVKFAANQSLTQLNVAIGLCRTYWHFLFIIWLLLFGLLTSSAETYNQLAQLCGF